MKTTGIISESFFLRFIFAIVLLSCAVAGVRVGAQSILSEIPKNISMEYACEEYKNEKWRVLKKTRVLWDFEKQRVKSICVEHDDGTPEELRIIIRSYLNGRYLVSAGEVKYAPERFDVGNFLKNGKQWGLKPTVAFIDEMALKPEIDPLMFFFYGSSTKPYSLIIDREAAVKKSIQAVREGTAVVLATEDSPDQKITFHFDSKTGFPKAKTIFSRAPHIKKQKGSEAGRIIDSYDVKQVKMLEGFPLPLEIIRDVELYSSVSDGGRGYVQRFSNNARYRYRVNPQDIQINKNLKDIEFWARIPSGSSVYDAARGISYDADGMSDEFSQESLVEALEAAMKEAEFQKKALPLETLK